MNIDLIDDHSSNIDSMSVQSESGPFDKFICLTKDGLVSSDVINIYFRIDYMPDKKWLINVSPAITMEEFGVEITKYLYNQFEEFCDLSALKVTKIIHAIDDRVIPIIGCVSNHLRDGDEVICDLESFDIWVNVYLQFVSADRKAQAYVKMRVENNLSVIQVKHMCQKLALIVWNKFCNDSIPQPEEKVPSPAKSKCKLLFWCL